MTAILLYAILVLLLSVLIDVFSARPLDRRLDNVKEKGQANMLDKKKKEKIIEKYKTHESDTGSSPVQIAILTEEIKELTKHLKTHKKDFSSRRGLLRKVAERRRLLSYLRREDEKEYERIVKDLKLKVIETKFKAAKIEEEAPLIDEVESGVEEAE